MKPCSDLGVGAMKSHKSMARVMAQIISGNLQVSRLKSHVKWARVQVSSTDCIRAGKGSSGEGLPVEYTWAIDLAGSLTFPCTDC